MVIRSENVLNYHENNSQNTYLFVCVLLEPVTWCCCEIDLVRLQNKNVILSCLDDSEGSCTGTGSGQTELRWRCGECEFAFSLILLFMSSAIQFTHKFEKQNRSKLKNMHLNTALLCTYRS